VGLVPRLDDGPGKAVGLPWVLDDGVGVTHDHPGDDDGGVGLGGEVGDSILGGGGEVNS
jgi:hypothetical protein